MKIIDKNGKIFSKISIIDIVIVLAILFLVLSFAFSKTSNSNGVTVSKQEIKYTTQIKVYGMIKTERSPFAVNDNIYGSNGEFVGKVVSLEVKPTVSKVKLTDGTHVDHTSEEYVEYFITLEGSGTQTDKGVFASGTLAVIPNNNISISSKLYVGNAIVLSVEKIA